MMKLMSANLALVALVLLSTSATTFVEAMCSTCIGAPGDCIDPRSRVCVDSNNGVCPSGMDFCVQNHVLAACYGCTGNTIGTCRHVGDGTCFSYQSGTACPAGTVNCRTCVDCVGDTHGPCLDSITGMCGPYLPGTTSCPFTSQECPFDDDDDTGGSTDDGAVGSGSGSGPAVGSGSDNGGTTTDDSSDDSISNDDGGGFDGSGSDSVDDDDDFVCETCLTGTTGPCVHNGDGSCVGYFPGTTICPPGTHTRCVASTVN